MNQTKTLLTLIFSIFLSFSASTSHAAVADLVGMLTSQLGVSDDQALGGAGAIFKAVKGSVSSDDFKTITDKIPGVGEFLNAAPETSEKKSKLGQLGSMLGGEGGTALASMDMIKQGFKVLGIESDMVSKFVPIVLQYAQSEGGEQVVNLMKGALGMK